MAWYVASCNLSPLIIYKRWGGFVQFLIILLYLCIRISQAKRFLKTLWTKRTGVRYLIQRPRNVGSNNCQRMDKVNVHAIAWAELI